MNSFHGDSFISGKKGKKNMNNFVRMLNEDFISGNNALNAQNIELLPPVREQLKNEIIQLLEEYDWDTGYGRGVDVLLDTWWENKGRRMTEMFGCHPSYVNGKFMVVLKDTPYKRDIDRNEIRKFRWYVQSVLISMYPDDSERDFSRNYYDSEQHRYRYVTEEGKKIIDAFDNVLYYIEEGIYDANLTKEMAERINETNPNFRAHAGQKISRFVGKICREYGIDKDEKYNQKRTPFFDAVSPNDIRRTTVISWHPVDYLTMSFGNSWASCHSIDKNNIRDMPDNYSGEWCGGTLSYMNDKVSIVLYATLNNVAGNHELADKIIRNMFHIDPERYYFIQGRMYPQDNDGVNSIYKVTRTIMQEVIAECWKMDNRWLNVKGTDACSRLTCSVGAHYTDYVYYDNCNVSYNKNVDDVKENAVRITIGSPGVCICCGGRTDRDSMITCDRCAPDAYREGEICRNCGDLINEYDVYWVDDNPYCRDCVECCECCDEWVVKEDITEVKGYGYVCESCLEYDGRFVRCECCDEWFDSESDGIRTEDGSYYCDEECAERDGYVMCESCEKWFYGEDGILTEDGSHYCDEECAERDGYVKSGETWIPEDEIELDEAV